MRFLFCLRSSYRIRSPFSELFLHTLVYFITSRVCGRGNVFVVSVCVCVCVRAITFEPVDIETSFLV